MWDFVLDGRRPQSFLAPPGAKEVGVEMFSMSKTYGMAGWRLGFVVGNAEVVARVNLLQDHVRAGVFRPVQEAGIAGSPARRTRWRTGWRATRPARPVVEVERPVPCEGTFSVWFELSACVTPATLLTERRAAVVPGEGFAVLRPHLRRPNDVLFA